MSIALTVDQFWFTIDTFYKEQGRGLLILAENDPPSYLALDRLHAMPIDERDRAAIIEQVKTYTPGWETVVLFIASDGEAEWRLIAKRATSAA